MTSDEQPFYIQQYREQGIADRVERHRAMALRSLHTLSVIRARADHPGLASLWRTGDAEARPTADFMEQDYRLTDRGRELARRVLKESEAAA